MITKKVNFSLLVLEEEIWCLIGWYELILADIAYRSSMDKLLLWPERTMDRNEAEMLGCQVIFDRIINELTIRMRDLAVDRIEFAALRCAILMNPSKFHNLT